MAPYLSALLRSQQPRPHAYAEPFAGGAGAALKLLVDEVVRRIYINDLSPGIAAFWRSVFTETEALARMVEDASVNIDAWHRWRSVFEAPGTSSTLELGYATFFLNRCNRSGILSARPIGGLDQTGRWKIDARFNAKELASRIRLLGAYRKRVRITELDARDFLRLLEDEDASTFAYVDPPYIVQGADLYLDGLTGEDHRELAELLRVSRLRWMLTYDVHDSITDEFYTGLRAARFSIAHTAQLQHVGSEYVVFSDNLAVPHLNLISRANAEWVAV